MHDVVTSINTMGPEAKLYQNVKKNFKQFISY